MVESIKNYNRIVDGPMSHREQAMLYFDVLNRDGLGKTFFCNKNEGYGQYCTRTREAFEGQYDLYANNSNCYIPLNLFTGRYRLSDDKTKRGWFRTDSDVTYINGILVDFDIMKNKGKDPNITYSIEDGDEIIDKIIDDMNRLVEEKNMVSPTLLTKSGRGLQYIILYDEPIRKTDSETLLKHRKLYATITTYLQSLYDRNLVEVDTAVTDAPRVCRLPGTKHIKNDKFAELQEYNSTSYYNLDNLCDLFEVDFTPEEKKKVGRPKKEKDIQIENINEENTNKSNDVIEVDSSTGSVTYHPIGRKELPKLSAILRKDIKGRIAMMEKLAQSRGMVSGDMREVMCFWYYCHQRQIALPIAAMQNTYHFNRKFDEPLSLKELIRCIKSVQSHYGANNYPDGYYVCSRDTLAAKLCMSEDELKETKFFQRREERKRAAINNVVKNKNKQFLFAMLSDGALDKSTIVKLTMEHTKKSQATIYRWINELEKIFSFSHILKKNNIIEENQGGKNSSDCEEELLPSGIESEEWSKNEIISFYDYHSTFKKFESESSETLDGQVYKDKHICVVGMNSNDTGAFMTKDEYIERYVGNDFVEQIFLPQEITKIRPLKTLFFNKQGKIDTHRYLDSCLKGHWEYIEVFRNGTYKKRWVFNEIVHTPKNPLEKVPVPYGKRYINYLRDGDKYDFYIDIKKVFNEQLETGIERIHHEQIIRDGVIIYSRVTRSREFPSGNDEKQLLEEWVLSCAM